jgi:uncharacterized membrane protein
MQAMKKVIEQGQVLFAVAIVAFGIEHIICARFGVFNKSVFPGETVLSVIPWVPTYPWLGYLTGLFLVATGVSIAANIRARMAAILLGILFLLCVLPRITSIWVARTGFFEILAMCGSALTLAGTLAPKGNYSPPRSNLLDWLIKSGRFIFAIALVIFGIDHFLFLRFVAGLVPPWVPWHMFWAFFFGCAMVAAGVSIATKWMGRWGATLIGAMFLLWFLVLHIPRALGLAAAAGAGAPRNPNEWSSAFIALAMCGGSWICAKALSPERLQPRGRN